MVGLLAGCWQADPQPTPLTIDRTSPPLGDETAPVLLNDALTVYFSAPIQPLSVTPDSVTLLDEAGHQVPGSLEVGDHWLAFHPIPPLAPDLMDGSFRPGGRYRLMIAGYPRPDSVRASDGRWLAGPAVYDVHIADLSQRPPGLPSLLRPPAPELPFLLRSAEVPLQQVAADAPRLQLHFTQPLLPASVVPEAFEIRLLKEMAALQPRSVRVVTSQLDEHPGSTVEIDLGALPQREGGSQVALRDGDWISVVLRPDGGLSDYAGNAPLPATALWWTVVEGGRLPLCEWPAGERAFTGADERMPGFEVVGSMVRPRVRVEAGNGRLGVFRPQRDVTLRPGQPFDAGDGRIEISDGADFPFLLIDVPAGVTVTIDADNGPVRLLACGGARILGELALRGPTVPLPAGRFLTQPVRELLTTAPVTLLAAGDIEIAGNIHTKSAIGAADSALLVATAGVLRLHGDLPFQTMLVVESQGGAGASRIEGPRGQSRAYSATFTYGAAPGADLPLAGRLPWRQLPLYRDSGTLQLIDVSGGLTVAWQATPADAVRGTRPDLGPGRSSRWQTARDGDVVFAGAGGFVRLELTGRVRSGQPLPRIRELRLVED